MVEVKVTEVLRPVSGTTAPPTSSAPSQTPRVPTGTTQTSQGSQTTNIAVPPKGASTPGQPVGATGTTASTAEVINAPAKGVTTQPGPDNAKFWNYVPSQAFWQALWNNGSRMARQWMVGMSQRAPQFDDGEDLEPDFSNVRTAKGVPPKAQPTPGKPAPAPVQSPPAPTQSPASQGQGPPLLGNLKPEIPRSSAPPCPPRTWWEQTWNKGTKTERDALIQLGSREEGWTRILSRVFSAVGPNPPVASGPWPVQAPNAPGMGMQKQSSEVEWKPAATLSPLFWQSLISVKNPVVSELWKREKLWRATLPESQRSELERSDLARAVAGSGTTPLPSEPFWNVLWKTSEADRKLINELTNRQNEVRSYLQGYLADPDRGTDDGDDDGVFIPGARPRQPGKH